MIKGTHTQQHPREQWRSVFVCHQEIVDYDGVPAVFVATLLREEEATRRQHRREGSRNLVCGETRRNLGSDHNNGLRGAPG